jgi:serine/threonine-protein kinase
VYLAEHLKLRVYRAIKCIPKAPARGSSFPLEDASFHEADLLKNLNHPGIPLIYDIDEDDANFY